MPDETGSASAKRHDPDDAQRDAMRARTRAIAISSAVTGVVLVAVAVVIGVTLAGKSNDKKSAAVAPAASASGSVSCGYRAGGSPLAKDVGRPPSVAIPSAYTATATTNQGTITIQLDGSKAPCTVNSFKYLASKGYFDKTTCHRLTTSGIFVLQCGDPTGTGRGGPGYTFPDENLAGATYPAGTVAMANAGPDTNGSQFFLVYKDSQLPPSYTPFGTVTKGLDVLTAIAAKGSDNSNGPGDGHPNAPVTITSVNVS